MARMNSDDVKEARTANKLSLTAIIVSAVAVLLSIGGLALQWTSVAGEADALDVQADALRVQELDLKQLQSEFARDAATIRVMGTLHQIDGKTQEIVDSTSSAPWQDIGDIREDQWVPVPEKVKGDLMQYRFDVMITNVGARVAYVDRVSGRIGDSSHLCITQPAAGDRTREIRRLRGDKVEENGPGCGDFLTSNEVQCRTSSGELETCKLPFPVLPGEVKEVTIDLTQFVKGRNLPLCGSNEEGRLRIYALTSVEMPKVVDSDGSDHFPRPYVSDGMTMDLYNTDVGCSQHSANPSEGHSSEE